MSARWYLEVGSITHRHFAARRGGPEAAGLDDDLNVEMIAVAWSWMKLKTKARLNRIAFPRDGAFVRLENARTS